MATRKPKPRPKSKSKPVHPGAVLRDDFLSGLDMSQAEFCRNTGISTPRLSGILLGKACVSLESALRLSRYLGTTPEYWLHMQVAYDLECARKGLAAEVAAEVRPLRRPAGRSTNRKAR